MPMTKTAAILTLLTPTLLAQTRLPQREQTEQIRTPKLALRHAFSMRATGSACFVSATP